MSHLLENIYRHILGARKSRVIGLNNGAVSHHYMAAIKKGHYNVTFMIRHFIMPVINVLGYRPNLMMPFVKVAKKERIQWFCF